MPARVNKVSPALKHGAYSEATLLPGEDPDEFVKLHKGLVGELAPSGRLEEETVAAIARLMWRRQNLARFETGQLCHYMAEQIKKAALEQDKKQDDELMAEYKKIIEANQRAHSAKGKQQKEAEFETEQIIRATTLTLLMKELDVEERLDGMIDRLIKRLLFVRGLKSITPANVESSRHGRNGLLKP